MAEQEVWQYPVKSVGLIGLSDIGTAICKRLGHHRQDAGIEKIACLHGDPSMAENLDSAEIKVCSSVAELLAEADLVLLCLEKSGDLGRTARAHDGLLDSVRQGQIVVDHGWSPYDLTCQLATAFKAHDVAFLDAPIARSAEVNDLIATGRLSLAVGGETPAVEAALPLLHGFASNIAKTGPAGSAQVARQVGDLLALQTFAALAEALMIATAYGVDGDGLLDALAQGKNGDVGIGCHGLAALLGADDGADGEGTTIDEVRLRLDDVVQLASRRQLALTGAGNTLSLLEKATEQGLGEKGLGSLLSAMAPERLTASALETAPRKKRLRA